MYHEPTPQPSVESDSIILDHRVRQQPLAHVPEARLCRGAIGIVELNVKHLALTDMTNTLKAEAGERALDGLTLRIEHTVL